MGRVCMHACHRRFFAYRNAKFCDTLFGRSSCEVGVERATEGDNLRQAEPIEGEERSNMTK